MSYFSSSVLEDTYVRDMDTRCEWEFLFADVAAFECGIGQLDWCNFRYTFSQNGAMLHFMHFCRFLTEVPLSAATGVR